MSAQEVNKYDNAHFAAVLATATYKGRANKWPFKGKRGSS